MDSPRQNPIDLKDHKRPPSPSTSPNSATTVNGHPPSAPPPPAAASSSSSPSPSLPPLTAKSNPTPSPYPTTFIQADTQSFKQVVQMLTGSAETTAKRSTQTQTPTNPPNSNSATAQPQKSQIPPISRPTKKPAFKLYERRSSTKNLKMISPLIPSFPSCPPPAAAAFSSRQHHQPEILSPSVLDFPKLALSPVTPLSPDPFSRSPSHLGLSPEDRTVAEKGFCLHPSPGPTTPRDGEPPKLLPLFPLTSPRMESSSAAAPAAAAESSA